MTRLRHLSNAVHSKGMKGSIPKIVFIESKVLSAHTGIPTLAYGLAGLIYARHEEVVELSCGRQVIVYFWYKETKNAQF
eukprot:TCALIF_02758-PB protein Name:"Protein of unknown function" AED:0.60 eAED:0.71 QI:0/0/0/1/0/0/2/0/78